MREQVNTEPSFGSDSVEGVTNMAAFSGENKAGLKFENSSVAPRALL
jgi:hypothetical protein